MDKIDEWMPWFDELGKPDLSNFWLAFEAIWPINSPVEDEAMEIWKKEKTITGARRAIIESLTPEQQEQFWTSVYATRLRSG